MTELRSSSATRRSNTRPPADSSPPTSCAYPSPLSEGHLPEESDDEKQLRTPKGRRGLAPAAAALLAGVLLGLVLMPSKRKDDGGPVQYAQPQGRAARRAQMRQRELADMLRDLRREQYAQPLVDHGIDRIEFLADADERDRIEVGVKRKSWKLMVTEAKRRHAQATGDDEPKADADPPPPRPKKPRRRKPAADDDATPAPPDADAPPPKRRRRKRPAADADADGAPVPVKYAKGGGGSAGDDDGEKKAGRARGTEEGLQAAIAQGWKFVASPGGYKCPSDCRNIVHPSGCHIAAAANELAAPVKLTELATPGSMRHPRGCFYTVKSQTHASELGINQGKGAAGRANPLLWQLCRCARWPQYTAFTAGTCASAKSGLCKPVSTKEQCALAAQQIGLLQTEMAVNNEAVRQKRPAGCHYKHSVKGAKKLFFNPDVSSAQAATVDDFTICECEPGERPAQAWPAPTSTTSSSSVLAAKAATNPDAAAKLFVNKVWDESGLPEPAKSYWDLEKQRAEYIARKTREQPDPAKYKSEEAIAQLALHRLAGRDKTTAGKAVGVHRFRFLDYQQRVKVIAIIGGKEPSDVVAHAVPDAVVQCMRADANRKDCEAMRRKLTGIMVRPLISAPLVAPGTPLFHTKTGSTEIGSSKAGDDAAVPPPPAAASPAGGDEADPDKRANALVNRWWEEQGLDDPSRDFREAERQRNAHALARRRQAGSSGTYDAKEDLAAAELKRYSMKDKSNLQRVVGLHRFRVLDNQERLELIKVYGARVKADRATVNTVIGGGARISVAKAVQPRVTPPPAAPATPPPVQKAAAETPKPPAAPAQLSPETAAEIKGFEELLKMGAISQAEFDTAKRDAIAKASQKSS